jgi:hypothetical protein
MKPPQRRLSAHLAAALITAAAWMVPPRMRPRYHQEWMAELDEYERQGISLIQPALRILGTSPATRRALRSRRRVLGSSFLRGAGDWIFRLNDLEARWRGWQITPVHAATGRRYRDPRFDTLAGSTRGDHS